MLIASAMMVVGCDNNGKNNPPQGNVTIEEFNTIINEGILGTQTYSAHIHTQYQDRSEPLKSFNMYSVSDDAIFDDDDSFFYNGYIRQKDQGIVDFSMLKNGSAVNPEEFYATDPNMKIHDFYPAAPSNIFSKMSSFTKSGNYTFKSTDTYAMAVIANLGMGIYAMRISNPEYFTVKVGKDLSTITVKSTFIDNYQSEEPGALPDTFVQEPVDITVTFTSVGETTFSSIVEYVANPDYTFPTPTAWSEADLTILKNHFNNQVPPFVEGLSYAYELKSKGAGNTYYALLVDYASGNLSTSYGASLQSSGFEPVDGTSTYKKIVDDPEMQAKHIYEVEMKYYDPEEVMDERTGEKWGFCYPNGVFQVKFAYKKSIVAEIKTVADLVSYLEIVDVDQFFAFDEVNSATQVTGFSDGTSVANQGEGGDLYHFAAPTGYNTFKVRFSYEDAVTFATAEEEYLNSCSELTRSTNTLSHTVMYGSDDTITVFQFTLMSSFNESTYPGYIEIRVRIAYNFYEAHKNDQKAEKIRVNYQVLNQNDEDVTSEALGYSSKLPLKVEKNATVNLSTELNNGYSFIQYEPVEPEESEKSVEAQITAGTFVNTNAISSFKAPSYDFTMVIRVNELDPSIPRLESISVVELTTEYRIGDTYSFDGHVMAHLSTGSDVDVTSQAVINDENVNTSVEDRYDVLITYTDEYGQHASTTVSIYVRPNPTYRINIKPVEGITIQVTMPSSCQAEENGTVRLKVTAGNDLMQELKVITVSGASVEVNYLGTMGGAPQYQFAMPGEDVVVTPIKKSSVDQLAGSYSTYVPLTTAGYYNKYTITFDGEGSGTYTRYWVNANPTSYTLYFSYEVTGSNITIQLTGFDEGVSNTSFVTGYRLFCNSTIEDPEDPDFKNINPTGIRIDNFSISFAAVNEKEEVVQTLTFYRE